MSNTIMTEKQQHMLMVLYALQGGEDVSIAGGAIANVLGGKWTSYRISMANKLQKLGLVECHKIPLHSESKAWRWFYFIPDETLGELNKMLVDAKVNRIYQRSKVMPLKWKN